LMGITLLAGYLVARIFFQPSLISVWCFFGIAVSILVYMVLRDQQTSNNSLKVSHGEHGAHGV